MNRYLLDTSVLSLLDPARPAVPAGFLDWVRQNESSLFASVVSIAEIEQGIAKLRRNGGHQRADRLAAWCDQMIEALGDRLLVLDAAIARLTGTWSDALRSKGRHPGLADVMIGATAKIHELSVLTHNERHFFLLEVPFGPPAIALQS